MLSGPLVYHDAAKQLCLVYFPQELNARPEEQERFIGEVTSFLTRSLPPDAPRAYLLTPRRFMTLNSLVDTVLEADGITKEEIERQRKRVELISQFAEVMDDETAFNQLVEQNRAELDYEFFATLTAFVAASQGQGRNESTEMLVRLHQKLVEATGFTGDMEGDDEDEVDTEALVEQLVQASDDELEQLIAEQRHGIDYSFFEQLTDRIEQAKAAGAEDEARRLSERRSTILGTVERMDREAQAMFEAGTVVLREVLEAPDTRAALEANAAKLDEAFMLVLSANAAAAERAGQTEIVARLEQIAQQALEVIQASMTPEDRFINELLNAETPRAATQLLRQNVPLVTPAFVKKLNEMADTQEKRGAKEASEQLRRLAREAGAMLF
jgi:hypothetical protein